MSDRQPAYVTVFCATCGAEPGKRCQTAEGEPFDFGGTHASRVSKALFFGLVAEGEESREEKRHG